MKGDRGFFCTIEFGCMFNTDLEDSKEAKNKLKDLVKKHFKIDHSDISELNIDRIEIEEEVLQSQRIEE